MSDTQNSAEDSTGNENADAENINGGAGSDSVEPAGPAAADSVSILTTYVQESGVTPGDDPAAPWGRRADGTPKAKPGRRRKSEAATAGIASPSPAPAAKVRSKAEVKAHQASSEELARALFAVAATTMSGLVGEEWMPESEAEANGMRAAIGAYIEAKGEGKLSPEAMLLLVVGGYTANRLKHENTRNKFGAFFGKMWQGVKTLYKRFFTR